MNKKPRLFVKNKCCVDKDFIKAVVRWSDGCTILFDEPHKSDLFLECTLDTYLKISNWLMNGNGDLIIR